MLKKLIEPALNNMMTLALQLPPPGVKWSDEDKKIVNKIIMVASTTLIKILRK